MAGVWLNLCYMGKSPSLVVKKSLKSSFMPVSSLKSSFMPVSSLKSSFMPVSSLKSPLILAVSSSTLKNKSTITTVCTSSADNLETSSDTSIPIYVMLPLGIITCNDSNNKTELVDGVTLQHQLRELKKCGVDGVMVDCWWGLVERKAEDYHWEGYTQLFELVKAEGLKLQVVMSFHSCGGNVGDDVNITLPNWVLDDIGNDNPSIFFTDEQGRINKEYLSWGIDDMRVLYDRSAVDVYSDFMHSFRKEFSPFFEDGTISEIEVGLGPCGELRYPSYPEIHGWRYPGIGQFQCYDAYLKASLDSAAESLGKPHWKNVPENMGTYNSTMQETGFFCEAGAYDSYHGRFFLSWYAGILVEHGDRVLSAAKCIFKGTPIAAKLAGVHWCYQSTSHAAELTAGFYNPANRDGYTDIIAMLKKHDVALNFTCVELQTVDQPPDAMADPERLVWQVLNAGWDHGLKVAAENALPCYTRESYEKILTIARPYDSPDGRHLCAFTYLRLSSVLLEDHHLNEFELFVSKLHGK